MQLTLRVPLCYLCVSLSYSYYAEVQREEQSVTESESILIEYTKNEKPSFARATEEKRINN